MNFETYEEIREMQRLARTLNVGLKEPTGFTLPENMRDAIRREGEITGMSHSAIVRRAINLYFKERYVNRNNLV